MHHWGANLRHIIFVLIEFGMVMFIVQLFRLVFTIVPTKSGLAIMIVNQMYKSMGVCALRLIQCRKRIESRDDDIGVQRRNDIGRDEHTCNI